jgi:hypothetical protein
VEGHRVVFRLRRRLAADRERRLDVRSPAGYESIRDHLAFYASRIDEARIGDERARPQPGGFYGGWVTDAIVGPMKGDPGSEAW